MTTTFNPEQQSIIDLQTGWHACLASAGSGKTEILTERVYQALQAGVDPQRMLCLTFTNRAAISMQRKVAQRLDQADTGVFTGNMHAFCYLYLQRNRVNRGVKQLANEQVASALWVQAFKKTKDLLSLGASQVRELLEGNAIDLGFAHYQLKDLDAQHLAIADRGINAHKPYERWDIKKIHRLILPLLPATMPLLDEPFKAGIRQQLKVSDPRIATTKLVNLAFGLALYSHVEYERLKQSLALYDFDDLVIQTLLHLHQHPNAHMSQYQWCQIDEVQDISPLQWLIIRQLLTPDAHVLLLGDINQSIYRFMGSSIETTRLHLGEQCTSLLRNYRSPQNLVDMTNRYCQIHFPTESPQTVIAHHPAQADALLHLHHRYDTDHDSAMITYAQRIAARQESVAILLPTNNKVAQFSDTLTQRGIEHFCINQHDIFSSEAALDFLAFISAIVEPKNRVAWSRLLWRFGDMQHHQTTLLPDTEPLLSALLMTAQLGELGCDLADFLDHPDCYQHRMRRLVDALDQQAWVFFDTETTGLDPTHADIIQLAAVQPATATDPQSHLLNLYCQTEQSLQHTQDIHHITPAILTQHGRPIAEQLQAFLDFTAHKALIAHHLDFDHAMLSQHYRRHHPDGYATYLAHERFCSLQLTKQLFPDLESYKLGDLLNTFQLEGVNSHDAQDDVVAGLNLMTHLKPYAEQRLDLIDAVVNDIQPAIERFMATFAPLWQRVQDLQQQQATVAIDDLLALYFDHVQHSHSYTLDASATLKMAEFRLKLSRHAKHHFAPDMLSAYLQTLVSFYKTAKESDLITDEDQFIVSTIHRAKGLEFEYVLLPAVMEDNFPGFMIRSQLQHSHLDIQQEAAMLAEEQKRLLYVALTRAKRQLVIGTYQIQAGRHSKDPSPFIVPVLSFFKPL
jgi:DNA helicase-2/ATP-dependent DNA helicase PcrA